MSTATTCPFCGVGCGMILREDAEGRVTSHPVAEHPVSWGQLCAKGWNAGASVRHPERLTSALLRSGSRLVPVPPAAALEDAAPARASAPRERGGGGGRG